MSSSNWINYLPGRRCPACRAQLEGHGAADGTTTKPRPGDSTVCAYCFALLTFTPELQLRLLSDDELRALPRSARAELETTRTKLRRIGSRTN